jgi:hypothetical protein
MVAALLTICVFSHPDIHKQAAAYMPYKKCEVMWYIGQSCYTNNDFHKRHSSFANFTNFIHFPKLKHLCKKSTEANQL